MTATSTLTLSAFLLARYDEWETMALATRDRKWSASLGLQVRGSSGTVACWDCCGGNPMHSEPEQAHIALNDPAFVLAQVASLRAVVQLHDQNAGSVVAWRASLPMLQALAQPWADHPDFPHGFGDAY